MDARKGGDKMNLIKLTLQNFKGVESFEIDPDGHSMVIEGDNGAGKTTLLDAYLWLTENADSMGRKNPDVRPRKGGDTTVVYGTFSHEGKLVRLERHQCELGPMFAIDGVEVSSTKYWQRVTALIFPILSTPWAFNRLHWTERRAILEGVAGMQWIGRMETRKKAADKEVKRLRDLHSTLVKQNDLLHSMSKYLCNDCLDSIKTESDAIRSEIEASIEYRERFERRSDRLSDALMKAMDRLGVESSMYPISWQMETPLKNGNVAPGCKMWYHGIPWSYLNHAKHIEAGLKWVKGLSKHTGVYQPCWIDNAEAMTNPTAPDGLQAIWLKAAPGELRATTIEGDQNG